MSNQNKYILIVLAIIIVVVGYYLLSNNYTEWQYNLNREKKNAYGTFLTYELLKDKFKKVGFTSIDKSVVESFRKLKKNKTYNYIFINLQPNYDSITLDTICRFVSTGNTVFISCDNFDEYFSDSILLDNYQLIISNSNNIINKDFNKIIPQKKVASFNFINSNLKDSIGYNYYLLDQNDTLNTIYNNFEAAIDEEYTYPLPVNNSIAFTGYENTSGIGLNFAVLKHGNGQFVILLSTLPFTNYFMRTEKGLEYVEKVFAYLPNQTTLWDNISHEYKFTNNHGDSSYDESILYFIINNHFLRWAWYLTLLGIIIYAIFHAKRRQNIIPIIEPKENNSLKYVETIGQLYFHEEEHIEIANEMRLQFMNFIRQKYYLKTNDIDNTFYKQLSLKSAVDEDKIVEIFNEFNDILKIKSINQNKLQHLNNLLEYFYKTCK